jgi:signal transduction histidine kinase
MPATTPLSLLRRVPPGGWTAVIWCASTAYLVRMYSGIPGLPHVPWRLSSSGWLVLALATAAAMAGSAALRRRPLPAIGLLITGSIAVAFALGSPTVSVGHYLAVAVAMGSIVASQPKPAWITALVMTLGVLPGYVVARIALGFSYAHTPGWQVYAPNWEVYALTAGVAWLTGDSVRRAREYAGRLRAHAAAEAVTAERLRISRELHDMVAHSIGIIALQSGAAARVMDTQPQRARTALHEVETASREALAGLRRMLGALRQAEPGHRPQVPPGPAPGLSDVDRLAAATTAAGVRVDVQWRGERRPLPLDIDLAAYRIVQESVTNVVRHAGTRCCEVVIEHDDEALSIEIADRGHGPGVTAGTGSGLAGMRERVALLHGDFTAEPGPAGGFLVTARLPLPAKAASI